jgi:hypothetical protein
VKPAATLAAVLALPLAAAAQPAPEAPAPVEPAPVEPAPVEPAPAPAGDDIDLASLGLDPSAAGA